MGTRTAQIDIDKSPDEVWAVVGDFGGIGAWMPGIDSCSVSGDERTISMLGMEIVERQFERDDAARSLTYGIVSGGLSVDHHRATIAVTPNGSGSHVTWEVDVDPDTLTDIMEQTYQGSLQALKDHLGG
jgi:carbon monoxide dehydrogenase subunit G